jgi:hypothetical protein
MKGCLSVEFVLVMDIGAIHQQRDDALNMTKVRRFHQGVLTEPDPKAGTMTAAMDAVRWSSPQQEPHMSTTETSAPKCTNLTQVSACPNSAASERVTR